MSMEFDEFTLCLLNERLPSAPSRNQVEIQNAHLAYLASLHEDGRLLAAGPARTESLRGVLIFSVPVDAATKILQGDPGVQAGWFNFSATTWMVPKGAVHFAPTTFPTSLSDLD